MSIYRSYFLKNNTLISGNQTNNSQSPVTQISYGGANKQVTRFIFDVDLSELLNRISQGFLIPNTGMTHTLHMTNTISYAPQYLGRKSYNESINRATSFSLNIFNINQDWDEGSGYDFIYNYTLIANPIFEASNWYSAKTTTLWITAGAYTTGVTQNIGSQNFPMGNESINVDITNYINQRLTGSGSTYTGNSYGLGIKFPDNFEALQTTFTEAVAFHTKNTNTWYEPYVETYVDDTITDDRNYFYLNKLNSLYLYVNIGGFPQNIVVNKVNIYDYEDNLINTLTGNSIINVGKGIYKINYFVNSDIYPDGVLFRDEWFVTINGRQSIYYNEFYLISQDKYYTFNQSNQINFDNYYFYFWGIGERENIIAGTIRKIKLTIKELYANQNNFLPLDIEYRIFTTIGSKYEVDVIPYTSVNRTSNGYEFNLDTSWLIPQDYYLQIRMKNGDYYENKQTLSFTIVNNNLINI
jgi:hypothetical protein